MKKLFYFLMVGLAFTALQVVTVEAQEGYPDMESPREHLVDLRWEMLIYLRQDNSF